MHLLKRITIVIFLVALVSVGILLFKNAGAGQSPSVSFSEPVFDEAGDDDEPIHPRLAGLKYWKRPEGPFTVALQAGHWKANEAPEEQRGLRDNTGAFGGGKSEWEVNLRIAEEAKKILEREGVVVEILPTTIPPNYWADVFVAIHADGNADTTINGYKIASSRRDYSGKAFMLAQYMDETYGAVTGLLRDPNVTRNMRGYYAFNWRRYEHSLHPMTPAVILETGFLTSRRERSLIVDKPEHAAQGIADAVMLFLREHVPQVEAGEHGA